MSVLISFTADKYNKDLYIQELKKFGKIYFGLFKNQNKFFDGDILNYKASLPKIIDSDLISYSESYTKDIDKIYKELRKNIFDRYCYFLSRANGDMIGGIFEYLYYFRIHIKAAIRFLDENNIKYIFIATPSMGFDNLLCEISKKRNIKVITLFQVHNNRFFWTLDSNDIGKFSTSLPIFPEKKVEVKNLLYDPHYMIRAQQGKKKVTKIQTKISLFKDLIRSYFHAFTLSKLIFNYHFKNKKIKTSSWIAAGNKLNFLSQKYVNKTSKNILAELKSNTFMEKRKNKKILFFLKVQPEATEAFPTNHFYEDQSLIIDKIISFSPIGTEIFIKEHPDAERNNPMARSNFWSSIKYRKNVYIIDTEKRISDLFGYFDIVATFDGMVGWEAIRNLKPVICFGRPWYLSMPGVFDGSENIDFNEVLSKKWLLRDISESYTSLTKKMGLGYVCDIYKGSINSVDELTNYEKLSDEKIKERLRNNDKVVANSFLKILSSLEV